MVNSNLVVLCANVFIELNKKYDVRKIYFEDIIELNKILSLECDKYNLVYNYNSDIREFIRLEYEYNLFFDFYEDYDGYIITLADGIDINNLENYFNHDIFKNELLQLLLSNIDLHEIFLNEKNKKRE